MPFLSFLPTRLTDAPPPLLFLMLSHHHHLWQVFMGKGHTPFAPPEVVGLKRRLLPPTPTTCMHQFDNVSTFLTFLGGLPLFNHTCLYRKMILVFMYIIYMFSLCSFCERSLKCILFIPIINPYTGQNISYLAGKVIIDGSTDKFNQNEAKDQDIEFSNHVSLVLFSKHPIS